MNHTSSHTLRKLSITSIVLLICTVAPTVIMAAGNTGELKIGYTYLDEEGFNVQQPSYNLYEGATVSLENLSYLLNDGSILRANLQNLSMNNRHGYASFSKSGRYGITLNHSKYRRMYQSNPDLFTRRTQTDGDLWFRPVKQVKIYGGYGLTDKAGDFTPYFEPTNSFTVFQTDYRHTRFNIGARGDHKGVMLNVDYRTAQFENNLDGADMRNTERFRAMSHIIVPKYEWAVIHGGFQHYEHESERDTLTWSANTGWGGAQLFFGDGFDVRYSFVLDRTSSNLDSVATDNLSHAAFLGKRWKRAQVTVGYQNKITDNYDDELKTDGFYASANARVNDRLKLRGNFGTEITDVTSGVTLIGGRDFTRYRLGAAYNYNSLTLDGKFESKNIKNDDIGSESDYLRGTIGATLLAQEAGDFTVAYSMADGCFENVESKFEFIDHTVSGQFTSRMVRKFRFGLGGFFYRSERDVQVESVSLRFSVQYSLRSDIRVEGVIDTRNYDDLKTLNAYYTANVIEVNLYKSIWPKEDEQ